jgi:hypothetical protein
MVKCAVIGNGPCRSAFDTSMEYEYRIGCNIPWTDVDSTIILDIDIIRIWRDDHTIIKCPAYFSRKAWMHTAEGISRLRSHIIENGLFLGIEEVSQYQGYSSGNCALQKAVDLGYKHIDIYGMDSWFDITIDSFTNQFVPKEDSGNGLRRQRCESWRRHWVTLMDKHKDIVFNFIKE